MEQVNRLRVVVASPSDVLKERDILEGVAKELNGGIAKDRHLYIDISRWENEAYPGFHIEGPQGLIDQELHISDCDVLIGIFWKRFGTPTSHAKSGTEHEFLEAYKAWKNNGKPHIMVYFNQKCYTLTSKEEADQLSRVLEFKQNYPNEGFFCTYNGEEEFEKYVRKHLMQFIRQQTMNTRTENSSTNLGSMANIYSLDEQIALWLKSLRAKGTHYSYKAAITKFREVLRARNLDLDSGNNFAIASLFEDWAETSTRVVAASSSTYNIRLNAMNSFYRFACQRQFMKSNPLESVKQREERFDNSAKPLDLQTIRNGLKKVDRSDKSGKRNYALLCILLTTGWRSSEVANIRFNGVVKKGNIVTVISRTRGGKEISEELQEGTAQALLDYLEIIGRSRRISDTTIWISFARNETKGHGIGRTAIADICQKYFEKSKIDDIKLTYQKVKHQVGINGIEKEFGII